jgi:hypothetical protein
VAVRAAAVRHIAISGAAVRGIAIGDTAIPAVLARAIGGALMPAALLIAMPIAIAGIAGIAVAIPVTALAAASLAPLTPRAVCVSGLSRVIAPALAPRGIVAPRSAPGCGSTGGRQRLGRGSGGGSRLAGKQLLEP